jgi:hypothetical protein
VERLHPVALEEEVSVDVEVAAVIAADFNAELFLNISLVQVLADVTESGVAKVAAILALAADIIDILEFKSVTE